MVDAPGHTSCVWRLNNVPGETSLEAGQFSPEQSKLPVIMIFCCTIRVLCPDSIKSAICVLDKNEKVEMQAQYLCDSAGGMVCTVFRITDTIWTKG